jgi:hypothetical protein
VDLDLISFFRIIDDALKIQNDYLRQLVEISSLANVFTLLLAVITHIVINLLFSSHLPQTVSQGWLVLHLQHAAIMTLEAFETIFTSIALKLSQSSDLANLLEATKGVVLPASLFDIFDQSVQKLMRVLLDGGVDRCSHVILIGITKLPRQIEFFLAELKMIVHLLQLEHEIINYRRSIHLNCL